MILEHTLHFLGVWKKWCPFSWAFITFITISFLLWNNGFARWEYWPSRTQPRNFDCLQDKWQNEAILNRALKLFRRHRKIPPWAELNSADLYSCLISNYIWLQVSGVVAEMICWGQWAVSGPTGHAWCPPGWRRCVTINPFVLSNGWTCWLRQECPSGWRSWMSRRRTRTEERTSTRTRWGPSTGTRLWRAFCSGDSGTRPIGREGIRLSSRETTCRYHESN